MRDTVPDKLYQVVGTTGPEQIELRMHDNGEKAETGRRLPGCVSRTPRGLESRLPTQSKSYHLPYDMKSLFRTKKGMSG